MNCSCRHNRFVRTIRQLALIVLMACLTVPAAHADAPPAPALKIEPRWGTMWVAPQLRANWVILQYDHNWTPQTAPTGTVYLELPAGVKCESAISANFQQTPLPAGATRVTMPGINLYAPGTNGSFLFVSTTLKAGAVVKGKVWAEWEGGKSAETEFDVRCIDVPEVTQPKGISTGTAMWPYLMGSWPDFYRQYASMGFNFIDLWHDAIWKTDKINADVVDIVKQARAAKIDTAIDFSTAWGDEVIGEKPEPNALALFIDGRRAGPCPSYRGPLFQKWLDTLARIAASDISFLMSDEETYGTGNFSQACVCARCEGRWKVWLKANRPGLPYISPRDVIAKHGAAPAEVAFDKLTDANISSAERVRNDQAVELAEQFRAWLSFRAFLSTERYQMLKASLDKAVAKFGAKSSAKPRLGWWAGAAEDYSLRNNMQDGRGLSDVIDPVVPQLYFRYSMPPATLRNNIRRQAWATGGRAMWAGLDSDDRTTRFADTPGVLTAAVLETLMAGGKGYCMWLAPYMDTRQWAELAAVNGVAAKYEDTLLSGRETSLFRVFAPEGSGLYFHPWSNQVSATTRETQSEGLLLVSDYRTERASFRVERSTAFKGPITLTDAFTGATVAKLTPGQWDFQIRLTDGPTRLLVWKKTAAKPVARPSAAAVREKQM